MPSRIQLRAAPFALAISLAIALVLSAPFVGQIRNAIRAHFPGHFVLVVGGIGGTLLLIALISAAVRIRERRAARYGAIAAALAIAVAYSAFNAGANPESNAVERFHFLEYGLITFLFYRAWRPLGDLAILVLPALAGLIVGAAEEWFQWFIPNRVGELRDVFLNLVAIGCGLLFSVAVQPPDTFHFGLRRRSLPRVCRMTAATIVTLAAFVHVVHFGRAVVDADAGTFMSRYSGDQLRALQADRTARWRTQPPPLVVVRLSREDQYLSEGIEHVMSRNELWTAGDLGGAFYENLILEKYFGPVLDTPSYAGKAGHRWPPEQRAEAEVRAASVPRGSFVSEAYPYRLITWNPIVFWLVTTAISAALLLVARRSDQEWGDSSDSESQKSEFRSQKRTNPS